MGLGVEEGGVTGSGSVWPDLWRSPIRTPGALSGEGTPKGREAPHSSAPFWPPGHKNLLGQNMKTMLGARGPG